MKTGNFTVLKPPVPPVKSFMLQEQVQIGTVMHTGGGRNCFQSAPFFCHNSQQALLSLYCQII